jgi:transcriptional regulator with XRE-family HTH domain
MRKPSTGKDKMPIRNPSTRPDLFAEALQEWMQRLGLKQRDIAADAHVTESTLSHWLRGDRPPDVESGLWLLMALHRRFREFQEDWTVAEVLDGIAPLGWSWEDIWRTLTRRVVESSGEQSFRDWWRAGKPRPLPPPIRPLTTEFVERAEGLQLRQAATSWEHWRQARWDALLLTGMAGVGKTTLLTALAQNPQVQKHFRDGILWLEGTEDTGEKEFLIRRACWEASVETRGSAQTAWARWVSQPERRLLVIVDDLLLDSLHRREDLAALVGPKGPQVVFAIASQKGARLREWLEEWLPSDRIAEWHLEGMREEEGLLLVEKVLKRKIQPEERAMAIAVGDALGWHPFGLQVTIPAVREEGWENLLQDLEQARARENWEPVLWAIERQWNRVGPKVRWEITRLLRRTLRGGPMGAMLAGAIWKPWPVAWVASLTGRLRRHEAQRAQWRLEELAQTGLVEEVTLHPAEWWRETTMRTWRVAPMLRWFILQKTGRWRPRWEGWKRKVWWMVMFMTRDWYWRDILPPLPDSLTLVRCLPNLLLGAVRIPMLLVLEQKEKRLGRSGLVWEWIQGKVLGVPGTRLRKHWDYLRLWPLEETEMFNWQVGMMIIMLVVNIALSWMLWELRNWVISIGMWDVLDGWMKAGANLSLLLVLLWVVWLAVLFVYPLWACVLYGVPDRELERVVQIALRVSRVLQQLGPLREQEEWLRKAWEHWRGEGSAEWDNATQ